MAVSRHRQNLCLILCAASLLSFPFLASFAFPHLFPLCSRLWTSFTSCLTTPLLILLINLVVAALAVTSGAFPLNFPWRSPSSAAVDRDHNEDSGAEAPGQLDAHEQPLRSSFRENSLGTARRPVKRTTPQVQQPAVSEMSRAARWLGRSNSDKLLFNAKSDQVERHSLKKSGTFDVSPKQELWKASSAPSEVQNVSDEDSDVDEVGRKDVDEVDQQAEDFIGKFYQQMKLQRLESIVRYKDRLDRSYGS